MRLIDKVKFWESNDSPNQMKKPDSKEQQEAVRRRLRMLEYQVEIFQRQHGSRS